MIEDYGIFKWDSPREEVIHSGGQPVKVTTKAQSDYLAWVTEDIRYKVGFTGTQDGMTDAQKVAFLANYLHIKGLRRRVEFHQGQCIGADYDALVLVKSQGGVWTVSHPPTNGAKVHKEECDEVWPEKDYIARNHDIVDAVDLLMVAPRSREEELRSGTWATYRYAKKVGKPILMIWPD